MSNDSIESLGRRLQRLEDLMAIRQVFIDYGYYLDQGDFDSYSKLFASEGEAMLGPMGRAKGPAAIKEMMTRLLSADVGKSYHLITSPVITLEGDRATSDVMWSVINRGADGNPELSMVGRHKDELIRQDGQWKFLRRKGYVDVPSAVRQG
jgi:hypothetical protein